MAALKNIFELDGKKIKLTNLDKIFWPEEGYSKYDLIDYFIKAAPYLLKYLESRLVNFQRFPDGIKGKSFYQKNCPDHAPHWVKTMTIQSTGTGKETNYLLVEDLPTLVWLANLGCLEIHPWLSSAGRLKYPDFAVFDLDPPGPGYFPRVMEIALLFKEALDYLQLKSFPKTSGADGLQIYVPLSPEFTYQEVRLFTWSLCLLVEETDSGTTLERRVKDRGKRVYLDYLQNGLGKTIIAPYSTRPLPAAPVSAPLTWEEVKRGEVTQQDFTIKTIIPRLKEKGDIFTGMPLLQQSIRPFLTDLKRGKLSKKGKDIPL